MKNNHQRIYRINLIKINKINFTNFSLIKKTILEFNILTANTWNKQEK